MVNEVDSGLRCCASFAKYDRASAWWRTSQLCLDGEWAQFLETWPRSGMTRNGTAYQLPPSALLTRETAFSLLPTPQATDATAGEIIGKDDEFYTTSGGTLRRYNRSGHDSSLSLGRWVKFFPTPAARDYRSGMSQEALHRRQQESSRGVNLSEFTQRLQGGNGKLNPDWVEWLMGYPIGYTALRDLETPSCRK
jgi:hypothetical protein